MTIPAALARVHGADQHDTIEKYHKSDWTDILCLDRTVFKQKMQQLIGAGQGKASGSGRFPLRLGWLGRWGGHLDFNTV